MALFEYECKKCGGYKFEKIVQKADDEAKCPQCGSKKFTVKLVSLPGKMQWGKGGRGF